MSDIRSYSPGGVLVTVARASGSTAHSKAIELSHEGFARVKTSRGRMTWYRKGWKMKFDFLPYDL